ncbi:MAG: undecaprenyl-diphosphate phosphatase [Bacteroidia bacterium]
MTILQAIIIAIVEGLTEYLPVSSTGHMILTTSILGIEPNDFVKFFTINIQLGAILAVVVLYFKRFFKSVDFYLKLLISFIPAAVLGILFSDKIDELLESPGTVAVMLLLGGMLLLFIDRFFKEDDEHLKTEVNNQNAFIIGLYQCIAMIPGVSRSAATIIGGLQQKLTRKAAAEYSFFLAVPTMFGATAKKVLDIYKDKGLEFFDNDRIFLLAIGNFVAFVVAMVAIKGFITFLNKHGFRLFGWYRIIVGGIILLLLGSDMSLSIV